MRRLVLILLLCSAPLYAGVAPYDKVAQIGPSTYDASQSTATSFTLNLATLAYDIAFVPTQAITVAKINFKALGKTGSPTFIARIETDTSGRPSGTLVAANTSTASTSIAANGWVGETSLTANASLSASTVYHLLIYNDNGTPASNNFAVNDTSVMSATSTGAYVGGFYQQFWPASGASCGSTAPPASCTWTTRAGVPIFMLISNDATPVDMGQPVDTDGIQTLSATHGYGVRFTAKLGGVLAGVSTNHLPNGQNGDVMKCYDNTASNAIIGTATLPAGVEPPLTGRVIVFFAFETQPTIVAGNTISCVIFDTTATDRLEWVSTPSSPDYRTVAPDFVDFQWTDITTAGSPYTFSSSAQTSGKLPGNFRLIYNSITAAPATGGATGGAFVF